MMYLAVQRFKFANDEHTYLIIKYVLNTYTKRPPIPKSPSNFNFVLEPGSGSAYRAAIICRVLSPM